jgi:DNA (cytosine-5)-methyltransferase 1
MIGNAVPVNLAKHLALSIKSQIENIENKIITKKITSLTLENSLQ